MPSWIWIQNVVFPLLGMGMGGMVLFGIYRTVNRVIDRRLPAKTSSVELDRLRDEFDELRDAHRTELAELYERVEFTERLLARGKESPAEP